MSTRPALLFLAALGAIALLFSFNIEKRKTSVHAAQSSEVPPPSAERADRFGIYNWGINDAAFPNDGTIDRLNWGADKVAAIGSRTIRVTIATRDDYKVNPPGETDLVQIARSPAYDKLFRDSRFQTYLLTTYTLGDVASNWADGYTSSEYATERDEIKRFCEYLLGNPAFANKTFIILNWEGDNAMYAYASRRSAWDYYTNWIRARADGVKLARLIYSTSNVKLYSGLEFNTLKSPVTGEPCGAAVAYPTRNNTLQNRCVIDFVAPQVEVDYYSYSSWSSLQDKVDNPNESLKQRFKTDLDFALSKIKTRRPEITERNFIVGEFGFERSQYGECNAANYTGEMFDAFDGPGAFQVSYAIFWQIVDNRSFFGVGAEHFGLYRVRDLQLSLSIIGDTFRKRIAGQTATNYTGCPLIRRPPPHWGVLNQQGEPQFQLNPDTVISIYTAGCCQNPPTPFSASGNVVHFNQATNHFILPRDNTQFFYESSTQINFSMPTARRSGEARVYVTDARGFDSNSQFISISCAVCPRINTSCGVIDSVYQTRFTEQGGLISISGDKFSPSGNTVIIEQLEYPRTVRRWTLPRENVLSESPTQINVKLPDDVLPGRDTMFHVINAQGLGSSDTSLPVYPRCQDCGPHLKPCQAMFADAGGNFFAGAAVTIYGRFSAGGNKVIIEQVDQQNQQRIYTLSQGSAMWSEGDKSIRLALPILLFPGRAVFHVIDAQGRETTAQEITINTPPVTNVSAANYRGPNLAAESIASAFGSSLAAITQSALSTPLPTEIAGARVIVKDSSDAERPAPLFFISPAQINYQVPAGTASGAATVTVFNGSGSSSTGSVQIVNVAPGLFSANATGRDVAAAVALRIKADGTRFYEPVAAFNQMQNKFVAVPIDLGAPGDQVFLILFGTGLRGHSGLSAVTATVGGMNAEVTFAGPQGTLVGLDQINIRLQGGLAGLGEVDVAISVDDLSANPVRVSIK
ncbi:MAG: hypothetical protein AB7U82_17570 [Blastocatellales bacterium]